MKHSIILLLALLLPCALPAQTAEGKIKDLLDGKAAKVGVAWLVDGKEHTVNNDGCYPLMSVFKLHGAIAVLRQMERRGTPVDTMVRVDASQIVKDTYTPMLERYPDGGFTIPFDSLLSYSVAESDNNACDIIISMAGGIEGVNAEMRAIGLTDCNLSYPELSMQADPMRSYDNCSTPLSVAILFKKLFEENILGEPYATLLKHLLISTTTGPDKIKAALRPGMLLAHKTGTGFTLADGTKIADNDAGAVLLPDGRKLYIAVLIKDSKLGSKENARLIAEVARVIIDTHPQPLPKGRGA